MGICGNSLIPIIITVVCCGALFVYCNTRVAELKNAVEKQNRVLTSFIASIQNDIRGGGGGGGGMCERPGPRPTSAQHLASAEAMEAVKRFESENDKIVVSDDEEDEEDGESDSDSDSDSDSESEDEDEDDGEEQEPVHDVQVHVEPVEVHVHVEPVEVHMEEVHVHGEPVEVHVHVEEVHVEEVHMEEVHVHVEPVPFTELGNEVLNIVEFLKSEQTAADANTITAVTALNYEVMLINDLRKITAERNLATKEEVKKLKKPELIALLKK